LFGKDSRFNSNKDSTVRYHILILRNKIDHYYENEGREDKIRLVIPKGHYEIEFAPVNLTRKQALRRTLSFLKRWEFAVMSLLLLAVLFLLFRRPGAQGTASLPSNPGFIDPHDRIWGSFFENGLPVTVILGDDFLMDEYRPEYKRYRQVRDWEIFSEADLSAFLVKHPEANLYKSEITGIPYGGADNLMDILRIVYRFQNDVSLRMSSTLSIEEIRDRNIIYIGEFFNLRTLNKIIGKTPIRFQYRPEEQLFILNDKGDTVNTFRRIESPYDQLNKYNVDYSLLIKMPGFSKENFIFIVGFGYGGRLERTKMLSDAALREKFVADVGRVNKSVPDYFIALFEVKSIERTGFTDEIRYFKEIPPDFFSR
jgi:hypothetical protein